MYIRNRGMYIQSLQTYFLRLRTEMAAGHSPFFGICGTKNHTLPASGVAVFSYLCTRKNIKSIPLTNQRLSAALALLTLCATLGAKTYTLTSPNGRLTVRIDVDTAITYSLWADKHPLIRMVAGPVDYTQGAMVNGTRRTYSPGFPMSQGTRAHQLAQYVVSLSPLNMLCDSPSRYDREPECTRFIASMPTVWDETIPLQCQLGQYVAVARRCAGRWYVAALGGWTPRTLRLDLTPLRVAGHKAEAWSDGVNADVSATDYQRHTVTVPDDGQVDVHLVSGGGFVMVIE